MNKIFYPKLAINNVRKNAKTYVPYILTCICTVMMYYIMYALSTNQGLKKMVGGEQLQILLTMGTYVISFFSIIFLFYTNSFLIKRRKKEFGLFNILGMEKRHISRIMFYETLYVAVISFTVGILGGILLSKLMFLSLLRILQFKVQMGFEVSTSGIVATLILFGSIFALTLLNTIRQIHVANPIELLKGGQTGEREPRTKWLLVLIGIVTLGSGYYIAVTTEDPMAALQLFFIAVILVIIGTYCLFTAGSIAVLKLLRKKKSYYYKTKHFISVSGMMYRMKQNAVGLANICILSTMVLVMLSTTVALYVGMEDVIRTRYPRNIVISSEDFSDKYRQGVSDTVEKVLKEHQLTAQNTLDYRYVDLVAIKEGDVFDAEVKAGEGLSSVTSALKCLYFIPLEDYNRLTDRSVSMEENEIMIYSSRDSYREDTLSVLNKTFSIKEQLDSFIGDGSDSMQIISSYFIVVKDMDILKELMKATATFGDNNAKSNACLEFDLKTSRKESIAVYEDIRKALRIDYPYSDVESAAESRESFFTLYGGLFFLGIFLGVLFMMATILIIYYKQISEGYEDKDRFEIMQKVGMSRDEVKKIIRSQVLTVFFLPLLTAVIHIAFAFPVITKLLAVLNLTNITLFALCTVGTILIFTLFYGIVYAITAREYYKIVQ